MRLTPLPLLVASAAALVLPDPPHPARGHDEQSRLNIHQEDDEGASSWWDKVLPSGEDVLSALDDTVDYVSSGVDRAISTFDDLHQKIHDELAEATNGGHRDFPDHTIYQLISESKYTTKFAKLVDEHEDIVKLLNSTSSHNLTLFAPVDEAFEDIPEHHEKPSKEFVEDLIKYHIGIGEYRAKRILGTNTIATALNEKYLGDEHQRLRTSVGLSGVSVNFYSRVIAADIGASNGVIHGVRSILVPPPMIGRILSLFPTEFSTLLLAYEKTDFVKFIHNVEMTGSTVFAPGNRAFAGLGVKVNAFLFNTEKGLKYLKALLKYHIAPDVTLYSDAVYDERGDKDNDAEAEAREHFDLKTLLGDAHVGVDTVKFAGFTVVKVNGFSNVVIRDAPGKNGVIQVVDKVLIPPCKHKHDTDEDGFFEQEMTVEDLMERLSDYVDEDESHDSGFEL